MRQCSLASPQWTNRDLFATRHRVVRWRQIRSIQTGHTRWKTDSSMSKVMWNAVLRTKVKENGFSIRKGGSKHNAWSSETQRVEATAGRKRTFNPSNLGSAKRKDPQRFPVRATRTTDRSQGRTKECWGWLSVLSTRIHPATKRALSNWNTVHLVHTRTKGGNMAEDIVSCLRSKRHKCC